MDAPSRTDSLILPVQMAFMETVARLHGTNPFEPAFEELVKVALRDRYVPAAGVSCSAQGVPSENLRRLEEPVAMAVVPVAQRLANGVAGTQREREVYQGAALWGLWQEFGTRIQGLVLADEVEVPFYDEFAQSCRFFFGYPGFSVPEPAHLFALFYQARRAWHFIGSRIRGGSPSAAAARAAIYRANLAGDVCAYASGLYLHMDKVPVLITGETGTGKEEAAKCIGWSRYVPVDPKTRRLVTSYKEDFHVRNLAAGAKDLIESALFGHKRGSFTGAIGEATGCFSLPKPHGTLFIDEVGELALDLQVKLLRPLEARECLPLGATRPHEIWGRHVFATNKNLERMCQEEMFREDLYHRMNSVRILMPCLRQMRAESPDELGYYVRGFVEELLKDPAQVDAWTERVVRAIEAAAPGYGWPGNLRELKKFVEAYVLSGGNAPAPGAGSAVQARTAERAPETRGAHPPAERPAPESLCQPSSGLVGPNAKRGAVNAEVLIQAYVNHVFLETGQNLSETARRTGLDRKTVRQKLDLPRLARWLERAPKKPEGK
jgi:DNA-binding NtrC family response regulator